MENIKILIDGVEKDVYGLFYTYDSRYYFIYTEKEIDENGYVILYMTQIGRETQNTPTGPVDTGYMIGVEITDPEEQKKSQTTVSYIVDDKKNNTTNPEIQYLPISMLSKLKILGKKRFRLLKSLMVDNFKLNFDESINSDINQSLQPTEPIILQTPQPLSEFNNVSEQNNQIDELEKNVEASEEQQLEKNLELSIPNKPVIENNITDNNVIVDYRSKYFEIEEENKELKKQIEELTQKLNKIKQIVE